MRGPTVLQLLAETCRETCRTDLKVKAATEVRVVTGMQQIQSRTRVALHSTCGKFLFSPSASLTPLTRRVGLVDVNGGGSAMFLLCTRELGETTTPPAGSHEAHTSTHNVPPKSNMQHSNQRQSLHMRVSNDDSKADQAALLAGMRRPHLARSSDPVPWTGCRSGYCDDGQMKRESCEGPCEFSK